MENGNEPINPILDSNGNGFNKGLTKREYFAGIATIKLGFITK